MKIFQLQNGYHYNSDTMALYGFISSFWNKKYKNVLDVGSGSGVLGMLIKRDNPEISLSMIDIQDENVALCNKNLSENDLNAKVILTDFKMYKSDIRYDLIISNPPFYHDGVTKSDNKHIAISRYDKYLTLDDFIRVSNTHLNPNAELMFCYDSMQLSEIFISLNRYKLNPTHIRFVHASKDKNARLVLVRAKKNSRSKCEILPVLFMKENRLNSQEATKIYTMADLQSELC
ncbi:tRNA1(Val) (adenine(37)-N6)-methyltransferase [Campylobacter majalis]|uniref:tRNA1(Val) (Adenine(37)-N6)-methyltransferase n=1 Tax=Campylobacter majalis TaxID=2790656 RepID=A0ABN7K2J9_9BACT|nr:methyltransferase [Campylobacter majalis]CAD7286768.1 tRNA1(Val) (adenine(37)-N6)-methyltransferase [Campylobacter majalis]